MDTWLTLPSDPVANVFDESGTMIQWSCDSGDDPQFQTQWSLPHEKASVEELKRIGLRPGVADSK